MKDTARGMLLKDKPVSILSRIYMANLEGENPTVSEVALDVTTFAHTNKIVNQFEDMGLITREREGRSKPIQLTSEGEDIADIICELEEELRRFTEE